MGKVEGKKIWCNWSGRITLCLKPTITITPTAIFGFWVISSDGHLFIVMMMIMIPAVNIQRHRCIRRWRVYPTMFLNHVSLSSLDSLWAPLLRKKFRRKVILLGRKHSGNDPSLPLSLFFFLFWYFSLPFLCSSISCLFFFLISNTLNNTFGLNLWTLFPISLKTTIFRYILCLHLCTYISFHPHDLSWRTSTTYYLLLQSRNSIYLFALDI